MTTKIINGKIILTDEILDGYSLYFADGVITAVTTDDLPCDTVIDAAGQYVSPGFIDIHTHGAGGADFLDGTAEAYRTAAKMHGDHGTTTLLPTTTSVDRDGILVAVKAYEEARQTPGLPDMPGLHLEGPNLAASQKGAQEERFIHPFDQQETLDILNSTDRILRWTAAPELEGAE